MGKAVQSCVQYYSMTGGRRKTSQRRPPSPQPNTLYGIRYHTGLMRHTGSVGHAVLFPFVFKVVYVLGEGHGYLLQGDIPRGLHPPPPPSVPVCISLIITVIHT